YRTQPLGQPLAFLIVKLKPGELSNMIDIFFRNAHRLRRHLRIVRTHSTYYILPGFGTQSYQVRQIMTPKRQPLIPRPPLSWVYIPEKLSLPWRLPIFPGM